MILVVLMFANAAIFAASGHLVRVAFYFICAAGLYLNREWSRYLSLFLFFFQVAVFILVLLLQSLGKANGSLANPALLSTPDWLSTGMHVYYIYYLLSPAMKSRFSNSTDYLTLTVKNYFFSFKGSPPLKKMVIIALAIFLFLGLVVAGISSKFWYNNATWKYTTHN